MANSGPCALGEMSLLISVSRASAFRLEKMPSLRFGAGTGGAGGGLGLSAFGAGAGLSSPTFGLDSGGSCFFCVNCSYSS